MVTLTTVGLRGLPATAPALRLTLAGATIALIFSVAFMVPQPLWNGQPARPGVATSQPIGLPGAIDWIGLTFALAYAVAWTLPFRPYALALELSSAVGTRVLLGLTAALATVALLIFPGFGSDLFVYVDYARLWAIYSEHPILAAPITQPADWAFQFVWIPNQPSPYGPLWAALTWPIARLAGTSIAANVAAYKLLALAGYSACCWLIWTWPGRQADRATALLVFAWSPLVLFETLAKGHNDVLLALSALLTFRLGRRGGLFAAVLGGLVKATGLAVVPGAVLTLVRRRAWLTLVGSLCGAGVLAVAAYAPFWQGPETLLPILTQTSRVVWSPGSLFIAAGLDVGAVRVLLTVAWAAASGVVLWRVRDPVISGCVVMLLTFLLLTTAFFAHYLVPMIALSAVSGQPRLQQIVMALSIGSMGAYAVELLNLAFGAQFIGSPSFQTLGSCVLLLPASVVIVAGRARAKTG